MFGELIDKIEIKGVEITFAVAGLTLIGLGVYGLEFGFAGSIVDEVAQIIAGVALVGIASAQRTIRLRGELKLTAAEDSIDLLLRHCFSAENKKITFELSGIDKITEALEKMHAEKVGLEKSRFRAAQNSDPNSR